MDEEHFGQEGIMWIPYNQIARSVNAGTARAEDAKRGLYLLDQVYELMYQIAKK